MRMNTWKLLFETQHNFPTSFAHSIRCTYFICQNCYITEMSSGSVPLFSCVVSVDFFFFLFFFRFFSISFCSYKIENEERSSWKLRHLNKRCKQITKSHFILETQNLFHINRKCLAKIVFLLLFSLFLKFRTS